MDSVQEQEAKKQKLEQPEDIVQEEEEVEEEETDEYTEEDLKLGHELIAAVVANDLVKYQLLFYHDSRSKTLKCRKKQKHC